MSPQGVVTTMHFFSGADGSSSFEPLIQARDGYLYGTTTFGGSNGNGTVFRIGLDGTFTSLYSFTNGADGSDPFSPVIQAADGNFYGTTCGGGVGNNGTVFRMTPNGLLTTLHTFNGSDGSCGNGVLVEVGGNNEDDEQNGRGALYGTTSNGGTNNAGTIFKITRSGTLTTLHSFTGPDGAYPLVGLIQARDGLYGTAYGGGVNNNGTVFRLTLAPSQP
jgi:uncharacterized repeat protein (TIGR03803 family)